MNGLEVEVLLVEDNTADASLIQDVLGASTRPQVRVDREERLDSGMKRLAERGYDAVLLDLGLPDDPGLEALLRVREAFPDVAVVVLTRPGNDAIGSKAVDLGAIDALSNDGTLTTGDRRGGQG